MDGRDSIETTLLALLWQMPERCPERTLQTVMARLADRSVVLTGNLHGINPWAVLCLLDEEVERPAA